MDAFYNKYRPRTIDELDNARVRRELAKIVVQKDLPHAFLFIGPKGIGKTSTARILAKTLACPQRHQGKPCGKCAVCRATDKGSNLDIIEIDAASNRGIDDIRQIRERVGLAPIQAANKIYIVDEVHMLTSEAFNAILKTLEEPPDHVYFIFCTTNPEKIPETVLSRLTTIRFQRAQPEEIMRALRRAVGKEKIKISEKALRLVAVAADGSFRDAHKLLYQLYLGEGKKISFAAAKKKLGRWLTILPQELLRFILTGALEEAMAVTRRLEEDQVDFADYLRRCLESCQQLLFWRLGVEKQPQGIDFSWLQRQEPEKLARLANALAAALRQEKETSLPALPLQLLIAGWPTVARSNPDGGSPEPPQLSKPAAKTASAAAQPSKPIGKSAAGPKDGNETARLTDLQKKWPQLLAAVKPMNHSVVALLKACRPQSVSGKQVTLAVFYEFHKERLAEERNRRIVETGLNKVLGGNWHLHCILAPKEDNKKAPPANGSAKENGDAGGDEELFAAAKEIFSN